MKISLKKAADFVGGKIYGDENIEINNVAKIEDAKKGDLTFLYLPAYKKYLDQTKASAVLINNKFEKSRKDLSYIEVDNPSFALQKIVIKYF
jgi:UDP-3-O-[3-hydroxymyristoyl] glucosamine N-acyltransferase